MTVCAIKLCHHTSEKQKKSNNITFHRIPNDSVIADKWVKQIRLSRGEVYWKPTKNTRICSIHFNSEDKYITQGGSCRLHRNAVPVKRLYLSSSETDSNPNENIKTEKYGNSGPSTSTSEVSIDTTVFQPVVQSSKIFHTEPEPSTSTGQLSIDTTVFRPVMQSTTTFPTEPEPNIESSELDSILDTPRKLKIRRDLKRKTELQMKHAKLIKSLKQKNQRLKKRNASLKYILISLKKQRFIDNDIANVLSQNVFAADLYNSLYKKISKNKKRPMPKYTPEFRKFCLTLNFYSPRAYNYVRTKFNTCLPHPKTLSNWYRVVDGAPGFTHEAFELLSLKVKNTNKKLICALIADEMSIRRQRSFDGNQDHGYVDMGTSDSGIKASEAYVLLLVCLNEHFKIPLGYFLCHGLTGTQKANLINICLEKCEDSGVKVVSLTFDGHTTNISCMEILGCQIKNPNQLKTTFKHPTAEHSVAVFLDPCHMMKLVRNHFQNKKTFLNKDDNEIDWDYIVKLNDLQESTELHIANKLTRKHLNFRNSIMNVKLAVQLLSRSVALALRFCREDLKLVDFQNSAATEEFIMLFNNIFDIFNTRRLTQHGFNHPISLKTKDKVYNFLDLMKEYILNLKVKTTRKRTYHDSQKSVKLTLKSYQPVLETQVNTGFLGILICIESLKHIFETIVIANNEMNYITTYRMSQDHIELFFGAIRMHGGHNDNPNARQFKGIYRKLLCHMEIKAGETGNCIPLEDISILTCSSALKCINDTTSSQRFDEDDEEIWEAPITTKPTDETFLSCLLDISENHVLSNYIIGYIAGFVVEKLKNKIKCLFCLSALTATNELWFHKLVVLRDKGGLCYVSKEVFSICHIAEIAVRNYIKENRLIRNPQAFKQLVLAIMNEFIGTPCFPRSDEHVNGNMHNTNLVRVVVEKYVRTRFFYIAKRENIMRNVESKRKLFRKQIQLQGF